MRIVDNPVNPNRLPCLQVRGRLIPMGVIIQLLLGLTAICVVFTVVSLVVIESSGGVTPVWMWIPGVIALGLWVVLFVLGCLLVWVESMIDDIRRVNKR